MRNIDKYLLFFKKIMFDHIINRMKNVNNIGAIRECFRLTNPLVDVRNIDEFIYSTGKIDILAEAFEKAIYKYDEENIYRSINIIKNWINVNYPFAKFMFKYEEIEEKLKQFQCERDLKLKINEYIANEVIIFDTVDSVMEELNITDEKWRKYIAEQLRGRGFDTSKINTRKRR